MRVARFRVKDSYLKTVRPKDLNTHNKEYTIVIIV